MKLSNSTSVALWSMLLAGVFLMGWPAFGVEPFIEIHAEMEVTEYMRKRQDQVREIHYRWPFRCVIGQEGWGISIDSAMNARVHYHYDGTNVYRRYEITKALPPKNGLRKLNERLPSPDDEEVFSAIIPGEHPLGGLGENLVWLAFCSGAFLNVEKRVIPLPGCEIKETHHAFAYSDTAIRFEDSVALPKLVELHTSRALAALSPRDPRLWRGANLTPYRLAPDIPAQNGLLKARYAVLAATNVLGWHLPMEFEYVQYREPGMTNVQLKVAGRTLSLAASPPPSNVLLNAPKQIIQDFRFRDKNRLVDAINYKWTNASVPEPHLEGLQRIFEQRVERASIDPSRAASRWKWLILAVAIMPAIPAYLLYFRKTNNNKIN